MQQKYMIKLKQTKKCAIFLTHFFRVIVNILIKA